MCGIAEKRKPILSCAPRHRGAAMRFARSRTFLLALVTLGATANREKPRGEAAERHSLSSSSPSSSSSLSSPPPSVERHRHLQTGNYYYPKWGTQYREGACLNDGNEPRWFTTNGYLFETLGECCDRWFPDQNGNACLGPSHSTSSTTAFYYYPEWGRNYEEGTCPNDGHHAEWMTKPFYLFDDVEECCESWFPNQKSKLCAGTFHGNNNNGTTFIYYYPKWGNTYADGECLKDGKEAGWMTEPFYLFLSNDDCCQTWFPHQNGNKCLGTSGASTALPSVYFYPKWGNTYAEGVCINDGNQAGWMAEPYYLFTSRDTCCERWFPNQKGDACMSLNALAVRVTFEANMVLTSLNVTASTSATDLAAVVNSLKDAIRQAMGLGGTAVVHILTIGGIDVSGSNRRLRKRALSTGQTVSFSSTIDAGCTSPDCTNGNAVLETATTLLSQSVAAGSIGTFAAQQGSFQVASSTINVVVVSPSPAVTPSVETAPVSTLEPTANTQPSSKPSSKPSNEPSMMPSQSVIPSSSPTSTYLSQNELMTNEMNVEFASDIDMVLSSESSTSNQFGVVLTTHAFNATDVDFYVEYTQQDYVGIINGYESGLYIFFVPTGTYPESLLYTDNDWGDFEDQTIALLRSKIFSRETNPLDHTWLKSKTGEGQHESAPLSRFTTLSLRLRRLNNLIYAYYQSPDDNGWVQFGSSLALPAEHRDVPLQFGLRVKKEWRQYHYFNVRAKMLAGGEPLTIPTKEPTLAPTILKTFINPYTNVRPPTCATTLDRSSWSGNSYEVRGVGGGGAMSGLSMSPWNNLWFVGTDMGTLFRSTDAGRLWYPVSHYEARYNSRLVVSTNVGYTSNPDIVLFSSCHEDIDNRICVAQRSIDAGITWTPVNVTGGTREDNSGNPRLDYIPLQWVGSLTEGSGYVLVTTRGGGGIYRSLNDGLDWLFVHVPFNITNEATGLVLDESVSPPYIYFGTTHGVFMWQDGAEDEAREIWSSDGSLVLQSFTGGRSADTGRLTLAFVDNNVTACGGLGDTNCGFVHLYSGVIDAVSAASAEFNFGKSNQKAHRVVASPSDATSFYVTGARSWPTARGTAVWLARYNDVSNGFDFGLQFLQADADNSYSLWPADKLEYSGVGLDVGYWDAGYYFWNVHPRNASIAGGSGNFFLHVTRDDGGHWESPFTEYADGCNTGGVREGGRRWRSTGIEMTSVRWLRFNPYNTSYAFASVADIRMLRSDDSGETWQITGGEKSSPLFGLNTVYDYDFAGPHTVFAVGGNFHDWPHEWYKNFIRGNGGAFVSFDSGDTWHRLGSDESSNCNENFRDTDCSLVDDMRRQTLSVVFVSTVGNGTLYIGTQSAGVARLQDLNPVMGSGYLEQLDDLQWEWINDGLGTVNDRIVPEIKFRNGKLYCLLTGDASAYTNKADVGIYEWDEGSTSWIHKRGTIIHPSDVEARFELWAYPTSFDVDANGTMWLVDIEANWNYLASGVWKSSDDGQTWNRMKQFTFPYHISCVGDRVYVSGARSISAIGQAGWGDGGMMHSDDGGATWLKNEDLPLLGNGNSMVIDPTDPTKIFYTFFGGGVLYGPTP